MAAISQIACALFSSVLKACSYLVNAEVNLLCLPSKLKAKAQVTTKQIQRQSYFGEYCLISFNVNNPS